MTLSDQHIKAINFVYTSEHTQVHSVSNDTERGAEFVIHLTAVVFEFDEQQTLKNILLILYPKPIILLFRNFTKK